MYFHPLLSGRHEIYLFLHKPVKFERPRARTRTAESVTKNNKDAKEHGELGQMDDSAALLSSRKGRSLEDNLAYELGLEQSRKEWEALISTEEGEILSRYWQRNENGTFTQKQTNFTSLHMPVAMRKATVSKCIITPSKARQQAAQMQAQMDAAVAEADQKRAE